MSQQHMQISAEGMELLAYATGKTVELDPETGRARLVHKGVEYVSGPADGAA